MAHAVLQPPLASMADAVVQKSVLVDVYRRALLGIVVVALIWPEYLVQARVLDGLNHKYLVFLKTIKTRMS